MLSLRYDIVIEGKTHFVMTDELSEGGYETMVFPEKGKTKAPVPDYAHPLYEHHHRYISEAEARKGHADMIATMNRIHNKGGKNNENN